MTITSPFYNSSIPPFQKTHKVVYNQNDAYMRINLPKKSYTNKNHRSNNEEKKGSSYILIVHTRMTFVQCNEGYNSALGGYHQCTSLAGHYDCCGTPPVH